MKSIKKFRARAKCVPLREAEHWERQKAQNTLNNSPIHKKNYLNFNYQAVFKNPFILKP
jgi:hypothetical protein